MKTKILAEFKNVDIITYLPTKHNLFFSLFPTILFSNNDGNILLIIFLCFTISFEW